jgi:hypothetical protein
MGQIIVPDGWAGVFPDMPMEEYHSRDLGVASASSLKILLDQSPAHYRYHVTEGKQKASKVFDFGRAAHAYVLEPQHFADRYAVAPTNAPRRPDERSRNAKNPSFKTLDAIAFWDDFDQRNAGKLPLSAQDYQKVQDMRAALDDVEMVGDLPGLIISEGQAETSLRWIDEETGLPCRARPDWWLKRLAYFMDYKTCIDASPRGFANAVTRLLYHMAHCHYADGARVLGLPINNYLFLCQEKEPPYVAAIYHIDAAAEERGQQLRIKAMSTMASCMKSGRWPGYSTEITPLSLPGFAFYDV